MRMVHYFSALALLVVPALFATAISGMVADPTTHLAIGLLTAIFAVATHTLMIVFMIVTGRVLKAAMHARPLDGAYLAELNVFFARKSSYPAAVLAASAIVATGVLGYAQRGFGLSPLAHSLVGVASVLANLWALLVEHRTLVQNQALLDRTAAELDRLDRERAPDRDAVGEEPAPLRFSPAVRWALAAASVWGPWLYWTLVVWKGAFDRVEPLFLWGTAFASLFCFACAWSLRAVGDDRASS
jgi:hypothetical protein